MGRLKKFSYPCFRLVTHPPFMESLSKVADVINYKHSVSLIRTGLQSHLLVVGVCRDEFPFNECCFDCLDHSCKPLRVRSFVV